MGWFAGAPESRDETVSGELAQSVTGRDAAGLFFRPLLSLYYARLSNWFAALVSGLL
jgi:hypothetical protein